MPDKCPKCNCQLDLAEGEGSDCCCGFRIERRDDALVVAGATSPKDE